MNKKIINFIMTVLLIKIFVTSAYGLGLVIYLIFFCSDWFVILYLTDRFNYERKEYESLQKEHGVLYQRSVLDTSTFHRSNLDSN